MDSYPIDIHAALSEKSGKNEKLYQTSKYKNGECYGIPYRCLIPQGLKKITVAGRIISADRIIMSSICIMSACFATGQAAGTVAVLGIKAGGIDLGDIDTDMLRKW